MYPGTELPQDLNLDCPGELRMVKKIKDIQGTREMENIIHLSIIHKKGYKNYCDNCQGIVVTSSISRIYGRILNID